MTVRIIQGDCRDVLRTLDAESVHCCVTDPPYHLVANSRNGSEQPGDMQSPHGRSGPSKVRAAGFMGKAWDGGDVAFRRETWVEVLRVLKPGGHLLAFGGTRTYHRMACAIEDAGFEIRDQIAWIYGSGFPKGRNLEGDWEGWGTALKPAMEPIVLARKPLIGTVAENVARHGVGAVNIDRCRIDANEGGPLRVIDPKPEANGVVYSGRQKPGAGFDGGSTAAGSTTLGRWPANVIHDGCDEVLAAFPEAAGQLQDVMPNAPSAKTGTVYGKMNRHGEKSRDARYTDRGATNFSALPGVRRDDGGSAARFFYCAKASRADRDDGLNETFAKKPLLWSSGEQSPGTFQSEGTDKSARNAHPTVKPTELMRYLVRLVTPRGGMVIDPFLGSGSTGRGAVLEGFDFVGIESDVDYVAIAKARIASAERERENATKQSDLFAEVATS